MAKRRAVKRAQGEPRSATPKVTTWGHVVIKKDSGQRPLIHINRPQEAQHQICTLGGRARN